MHEPVNFDDLDHRLGIVEVVSVPCTTVATRCMRWSSGEADIRPHFVEVGIDAAKRRETHQSSTSIRFHISSVSENPDTPVRLAFRVERPGERLAEKVAL